MDAINLQVLTKVEKLHAAAQSVLEGRSQLWQVGINEWHPCHVYIYMCDMVSEGQPLLCPVSRGLLDGYCMLRLHLQCIAGAQALRGWEESMDVWYALPCTDKGAVEELLPLEARLRALAGHVEAIMVSEPQQGAHMPSSAG